MKLTDEERNSLVILQLEKAKVFLKQADEMFDLKYWDIASNRYYYACFHAVQALLIQNGLSCKTHDGLIACFGLNFIKTGKIRLLKFYLPNHNYSCKDIIVKRPFFLFFRPHLSYMPD